MEKKYKLFDTKYYIYNNKIGKGCTSVVLGGFYMDNNIITKVAIKCINILKLKDMYYQYILTELDILKKVKHDNIVKYLDHYEYQNNNKHQMYIIFEYIEGMELSEYLLKNNVNIIDKLYIYKQIVSGINYLHLNNIIHRDIKPSNILIYNEAKTSEEKKLNVKIIDLGFAKQCNHTHKMANNEDDVCVLCITLCGTPAFMAPEILFNIPYSYSVDMWSLGALLYFMIYNIVPFHQCNNINDLIKQYKAKICPNNNNTKIDVIINLLLLYDLNKRMTCDDLLKMIEEIKINEEIEEKELDKNIVIEFSNKMLKKCSSNYLDEYDCIEDIEEYKIQEYNDYLFYKDNILLWSREILKKYSLI